MLLAVTFTFTVELTFGVVFQSDGIQAALAQILPSNLPGVNLASNEGDIGEKLLNSIAIKDKFDDVQIPLVKVTGRVELEVSVDAVVVKISVFGGKSPILQMPSQKCSYVSIVPHLIFSSCCIIPSILLP